MSNLVKKNILIIDDDEKILRLLEQYLLDYNFEIFTANDGNSGMLILEKKKIDLIVLDIMLPGKDGFEICRQIRTNSSVPIIMLTARGDDMDRIIGLEIGADDYLSKPFNPRELVARIKAVLRRQTLHENTKQASSVIEKGSLHLDYAQRKLSKKGIGIELSTAEFNLLSVFMKNSGIVLSRDRLLDLTKERDYFPFDRSIDVQVSRLRQKIEDNPKNPIIIKTVWGVGYVFTIN